MTVPAPITVAMPVYNGEEFALRALAHVRDQTFTDFEVVIRDNASTDATEEMIREFIRADPRFTYIRNEVNIGGARNSNLLLEEARSPLIVRAHDDDEMHPDYLGDSIARLQEAGPAAVVAYPRVNLIDEHGVVVGAHDDADLDLTQAEPHERIALVLRRIIAQIHFGVMRTDVARACGGISVSTAGEFILPTALALRGQCLLSSIEEVRLSVRQYDGRSGGERTSEAAWIDPSRPHVPFPYSRSTPLMLQAVAAAPLTSVERRRCYQAVLWNWTRPGWRSIAGDVMRLPWDAGWVKHMRRTKAA